MRYGSRIRELTARYRVLETRGQHLGRPTYAPMDPGDLRRVYGGDRCCDCAAGLNLPLVCTPEDGLVCTGCGIVVQQSLVVLDDLRGAESGNAANGSRVRLVSQFDDDPDAWARSPPYDRNVHWNEFLSLLTDRNPPVPDGEDHVHAAHRDYSALECAFGAWARSRHLWGIDALVLPPAAVKCLTEVLGPTKARKYRERWWHILRRFCCADWLPERFRDMGGPEIIPGDIVYRLKQRFRLFAQVFAKLQSVLPFYRQRRNIPYLPLVFSHLLYQDLGEGWERYRFFVNELKSPQCRVPNELRVAGVITMLQRHPPRAEDGVTYKWRYRCMLPVEDLRDYVVDRERFLQRMRCYLTPQARRARANKR